MNFKIKICINMILFIYKISKTLYITKTFLICKETFNFNGNFLKK